MCKKCEISYLKYLAALREKKPKSKLKSLFQKKYLFRSSKTKPRGFGDLRNI